METPQGLFKVNVLNDAINMNRRGASSNTPGEKNPHDAGVDFDEYNCLGASSYKGGTENDSLD